MPSGLYVRVDIKYFGINLFIFMSPKHAGHVEGLCGDANGQTDFPPSSWPATYRYLLIEYTLS